MNGGSLIYRSNMNPLMARPSMNMFDVAGRSMTAQMSRINMSASNLANADVIAKSEKEAYRAYRPVFETKYADLIRANGVSTVDVASTTQTTDEVDKRYSPNHPLADEKGYVYSSNVNKAEEMTEIMEASRQYQNTVEALTTSKALMIKTLSLGKG